MVAALVVPHHQRLPRRECRFRLDTPAPILGDWLNEYGWSFADLESWYINLMFAILQAGGLETVPAGLVLEELPGEPHSAAPAG